MIAVIWIDWYPYHIARFRALCEHPDLQGAVAGIEMVGKSGVHQGLTFRDSDRRDLPIETLLPDRSWHEAGQLRVALALLRKLKELSPTTVLIPGYYTAPGIAAACWARWHRRTSVLMTESGEQDLSRSAWKEWVKSKLVKALFDFAIAGGLGHERYLRKLGFRPERVARYYDVVDNRFFSQGAESARRKGSAASHELPDRYFLYVGRLAPEKNLFALIAAFAKFLAGGGDWSLVLAGDGPLKSGLQEECAGRQLGTSVVFAGMKTAKELPTFYAFAGCFVLPSTSEPWGLVVNEAMASGIPVLVSRQCGCSEDLVEDGVNGFVFDPTNEEELAGRMKWLSNAGEQRRREMGRRSREIVANYSPENFAAEVSRFRVSSGETLPGTTMMPAGEVETRC